MLMFLSVVTHELNWYIDGNRTQCKLRKFLDNNNVYADTDVNKVNLVFLDSKTYKSKINIFYDIKYIYKSQL